MKRARRSAISHLNKNTNTLAIYRAMGSLAFVAAARAWAVVQDKADPTRRLFLQVKNNLAVSMPGLAYRIIDGVCALEAEPVTTPVDQAMAPPKKSFNAEDSAREWLVTLPSDGPLSANEVNAEAAAAGVSWAAVRRVKDELIESRKTGMSGGWKWSLKPGVGEEAQRLPQDSAHLRLATSKTQIDDSPDRLALSKTAIASTETAFLAEGALDLSNTEGAQPRVALSRRKIEPDGTAFLSASAEGAQSLGQGDAHLRPAASDTPQTTQPDDDEEVKWTG